MDNDFDIYYRFNTGNEKKFLKNNKSRYHGIVISGHICMFYSDMVMTFLNGIDKPYIIDPVTYVFGLDPEGMRKEDGTLKKSYEALIDFYGEPFEQYLGEEALKPDELDWQEKETLVEKTIDLEKNIVEGKNPSQKSLLDYKETLAEEQTDESENYLKCVIPPYFYFEDVTDEFYDLSLELARITEDKTDDIQVTPVICLSKHILNDEHKINEILNDYQNFDGCFIWIADFDEEKERVSNLTKYLQLIEDFSEVFDTLISFYGGEFSIISSKKGLSGVVSGICYSTSKDPEGVTSGGGFPLRYYIPEAHTKTVEANARIYYTNYERFLCECEVCSKLDKKAESIEDFFEKLDREKARNHFIHQYLEILNQVEQNDISYTLSELDQDLRFCERYKLRENYEIDYNHIRRWIKAFENTF